MKNVWAGTMLAITIVMQGMSIAPLWAAEAGTQSVYSAANNAEKRSPLPRMRRPQMTKEQALQLLKENYNFDAVELSGYLDSGTNYRELDTLCLYAALSQKSLTEVAALRKTHTGERLKLALGLTPQKFHDRSLEYQSRGLVATTQLPQPEILKYLKKGYTENDIKMSVLLADKSGRAVDNLIKMRTITAAWPDIAKQIGIDAAVYEEAAAKSGRLDNSGKRTGAGFAGLRIADPTKEKLLGILHNDYGFTESELGKYYDRFGFKNLETFCIYAYFSQKPLAQVISMSDKYTWEGLKLALGLDPQKFRDRAIEYQADRLFKRMDIDRNVTIKYMNMGFPMHHVNTAALLARKCDKDIQTIMLMKTPANTWNDVVLELGLALDDSREVKDRITAAFKR